MKTKYTVIEPGLIRSRDLVMLDWTDVEFKGDQPGYDVLRKLLDPQFKNEFEHVWVTLKGERTCMFVDEFGLIENMQVNDLATVIYWTGSIMSELQRAAPAGMSPSVDMLAATALIEAEQRLATDDVAPRIHGRAVLFADRVWF